jgi:hypothetical protein
VSGLGSAPSRCRETQGRTRSRSSSYPPSFRKEEPERSASPLIVAALLFAVRAPPSSHSFRCAHSCQSGFVNPWTGLPTVCLKADVRNLTGFAPTAHFGSRCARKEKACLLDAKYLRLPQGNRLVAHSIS